MVNMTYVTVNVHCLLLQDLQAEPAASDGHKVDQTVT